MMIELHEHFFHGLFWGFVVVMLFVFCFCMGKCSR